MPPKSKKKQQQVEYIKQGFKNILAEKLPHVLEIDIDTITEIFTEAIPEIARAVSPQLPYIRPHKIDFAEQEKREAEYQLMEKRNELKQTAASILQFLIIAEIKKDISMFDDTSDDTLIDRSISMATYFNARILNYKFPE